MGRRGLEPHHGLVRSGGERRLVVPEEAAPAELALVPGWFGVGADELSASISDILVWVGADVAEGVDAIEFVRMWLDDTRRRLSVA
jgi:hypothetical protein